MKKVIIHQSLIAITSLFLAYALVFNPEKFDTVSLKMLGVVFLIDFILAVLMIYKVVLMRKIEALQETNAKIRAEIAEKEKHVEINNELLNEIK